MKSKWDALFTYSSIGIMVVAIIVIAYTAMQNADRQAYTEGYCTALGGTVLNSGACNVDGAVVEVQR